MSAVPGFNQALKNYESDKVKDRVTGGEKLREILGNREALSTFQEWAAREGGAGWSRLFDGLFAVVIMEKKAVMKRNATAQAEKRLAEAISLVRWMAERSVHFLPRRPLVKLVCHMIALLVQNSTLFTPSIRDYAKALRTILTYPPHLESLEEAAWKRLMSICWAGALGDRIVGEEQFDDEGHDELEETQGTGDGDVDDDMLGTSSHTGRSKPSTITQGTIEILHLIPILLSSPSAPLLPPRPPCGDEPGSDIRGSLPFSVGYSLLLKVARFLEQHPTETSGHLPVLRSCNIILVELELNSREAIIKAGAKLLPLLIGLWGARNKALREQLLIALRLLLPWLSHESVEGSTREAVHEGLSRLAESLGKETTLRWGIEPLDLQFLRISPERGEEGAAFRLGCIGPGFDFSHEMAFAWTVQQLYADVIVHLYSTPTAVKEESEDGRSSKRRKVDNPLHTIVSGLSLGSPSHRLLSLQILVFILCNHHPSISLPDRALIRSSVLESTEADDENLQSWTFIALAFIQSSFGLDSDADRVWASAIRKIATPPISRAAAFCASTILRTGAVGTDVITRDIGNLLRQLDIQGPPHPFDSICNFLSSTLALAQSDVRLYSQNLEDKVLTWLVRHDLVDGPRGRTRMDSRSASDVLRLLCSAGGLVIKGVEAESTIPIPLPECTIVERVLEEHRLRPVRLFVLRGEFPPRSNRDPPAPTNLTALPALSNSTVQSEPAGAETPSTDRQSRISDWLKSQIKRDLAEWSSQTTTQATKSSDRVRKSLDLAVLAILYQNTLHTNGVRTDPECLTLISQLLLRFRTELATTGSVTTQLFLWQAFQPLLPETKEDRKVWPIALRAAELSGIRSELMPVRHDDEDDCAIREENLVSAWTLPEVSEALRELILVARKLTDDNAISAPNGANNSTQRPTYNPTQRPTQHALHDDDDFGDINIAETDAMPVSKEALDNQRSAVALLRTVITFRLSGAKYLSPSHAPPRDLNLLNAFLTAEGVRMIQLGGVICEAIANQQLRISVEAIELVIGMFEEVFSTYAYARDEGLYLLVVSFLHASSTLWLALELSDSIVAERAMTLTKHITKKFLHGQVKSWRVRLKLLVFLDEYLIYEPDYALWKAHHVVLDDADTEWSPTDPISHALVDLDLRVRIRAATSVAELFYLDQLSIIRHEEFYTEGIQALPRNPDVFNFYLTRILFGVNCCIASGGARPAALFHLYETPYDSPDFNVHLLRSFETITDRLGFGSIQVLWLEHVEMISVSLLHKKRRTIDLPPSLSGYPSIQARAESELSVISPFLMSPDSLKYFNEMCEAAGTTASEEILRHIYETTARFLVSVAHCSEDATPKSIQKKLVGAMSAIPCRGAVKTGVLANGSVAIAVQVFNHLEPGLENGLAGEEVKAALKTSSTANVDLLRLAPKDPIGISAYPVSGRVSAAAIVQSIQFLERLQNFDRHAACFNSLLQLFAQIDKICSSGEQSRLLHQIVLVIATFADTFTDGRILQLLILEAVSLLDRPDIRFTALGMVVWGFSQISASDGELTRLSDIVARLGRMRQRADVDMAEKLDAWVQAESSAWQESALIWSSIEQAAILWPEQMKEHLGILPDVTFADVADLVVAEVASDTMTICEKVSGMIQAGDIEENKRTFAEKSFWHIKNAFSADNWTAHGARAFTSALSTIDGQIDTPESHEEKIHQNLVNKLTKEPISLVRALIILHLMHVVDKEDRTSRVGAYLVLRQLRPSMSGLIQRVVLPSAILKEVELLHSPLPTELEIKPVYTLASLGDEILKAVDKPDVWLRELSIRLCDITARDHPFFCQLRSFVLSPTADLAPLLPLLVQSCMSTAPKGDRAHTSAREAPLEALFHATLANPKASDTVIHAILNIVLHLRSYRPPYRADPLAYNRWFKLDFMLLSEAAIKVGSFATALLFLEILKGGQLEDEVDLSDSRLQKIMMAVYSNVNDPDGFYGVKINNVKESLRLRLNHEGEHLRAFGLHGAELEAAAYGEGSTSDLLASARDLHYIGIHRTALSITQAVRTRTDQVPIADDLLFEIAWRTGDWDLPVPAAASISSAGAFYSALRSLHRNRDQESVQKAVDVAMKAEMLRLKDLGSERMTDIQKAVDNLLSLREVALWLGPDVQRALAEGDYTNPKLNNFSEIGSSARYGLAERLHATKLSILTAAQSRESRNLIGDMSSPLNDGLLKLQTKAHLGFSAYARAVGNVQASINAITAVQHIEGASMSAATADEYGEVLWTQHEHSLALQLAEGMKAELVQSNKGGKGRSGVLAGRIAYWSYRAKLLPVKDVHTMFHNAHATLTTYATSPLELAQLSHDYAIFAAEQQAMQRVAPSLSNLREYRDRRARDVAGLMKEENDAQAGTTSGTPKEKGKGKATGSGRQPRNSTPVSKTIRNNDTRTALLVEWRGCIRNDNLAIKAAEDAIDTMTKLSLKMFAHALKYSNTFDDSIIKMCSIWLAHCDCKDGTEEQMERAKNITKFFTTALNNIPSYKFIALGAQLAARLHAPLVSTIFNDQLNDTVKRVSQDHPYHMLYQVIPLAHGYRKPPPKAEKVEGGRAGAAARIMAELEMDRHHPLAQKASKGMRIFSDMAIQLSLSKPPEKRKCATGDKLEIESECSIRRFSGLEIPVATVIPPIDQDMLYQGIPKILKYDNQYIILGGIHRPKRVTAYDDAGGRHLQLFKGEDDIRQDSVMEQVFVMTNKMLSEDRQTQTRKLRFRTYVVIPLAQKAGILEFVAEGQSIGDWLRPAHEKYRGALDTNTNTFRTEVQKMQVELKGYPDKIKVEWAEMTAKFRPVMRHYFTEKHKDPMGWFAMRLRYSRSVAVTSMVGWVLGVGDRHLSNIMIDSVNGELIHIDFGHVFESGRGLAVPERVPFRLTNDIVDGLGITGIEGTFRRCSQQTVRVLRTNSDLILTILEVFKHDPLYAWESDNEKNQREEMEGPIAELNKSAAVLQKADRVLAITKEKLSEALSVEYTVNMVVQEARDPEYLATIFHGWQAWY